ncbi:inter-alpha-trypsin inhibitor heavy chain H3-like [Clavelina lepadiformis]|uniref:inter-alpha-trypsin inhibitor heavy chain H3-like n=1 Tax=Clavelina lepadiformis TaxID=159417 RepID=UPI0040420500
MRNFIKLLALATLSGALGMQVPPESGDDSCEGYRSLLRRVLVQYSATYFADNPRNEGTIIDPNQIFPLTPLQLFREFYGDSATPEHFKEAILKMYYSDPGPYGPAPEDADRIILRDNIYTYAQASSYELAREKFGVLLYLGITDYAVNSAAWLNSRCIEPQFIDEAEDVITAELERIRNELGEFKFGAFMDLGSGTTLAFAIDDTGSMSGEIDAAKIRAKQIIDERQGSLDKPSDFVLVPFNHPTWGPITVTQDPDIFKAAIDRLHAHGGGPDIPELAMRGIWLAIENSREGSTVFVITDVDAKDVELQDQIVAAAVQKNIRIVFLLTNSVVQTQCINYVRDPDPLVEQRRCNTPSFRLGYDLYEYIANSTGGNVLIVSKRTIFKATQVIDSSVKQGVVDIAYKKLTSGQQRFTFDVDSSSTEIFLHLTGGCDNVAVMREETTLTIMDDSKIGDLFEGRLVVQNNHGQWTLSVNVRGSCTAKVIARSTFGFVQTLASQRVDALGQVEVTKFDGQPLISDDTVVLIDMFGKQPGDTVTSVDFVSQATGQVIQTFNINDSGSNAFRVNPDTNPSTPFLVAVRGTDRNGFSFSRFHVSPIEFVNVAMDCGDIENIVFRPGDTAEVTVSVENRGSESGSFVLGATDSQQYVSNAGPNPRQITVGGGSTGRSKFEVTAPDDIVVGTTSIITVTATTSLSSFLLYKTCRIVVGQRLRPKVESFMVDTTISSRFAQTTLTTIVHNDADVGREAEFSILLPLDAFITSFSMTIDGVTYDGTIREKEEAQRIFNVAKDLDLSAGHVAARDESSTVFQTSVNLEPFKRVTFELKYQELLLKKNDKYTYGVSVQMLQPVQEFRIDVSICEGEDLLFVNVPGFETEQSSIPEPIALPGVAVTRQANTAQVSYAPTRDQQTIFSPLGLSGRFVVEYDVVRESATSELLIAGEYFVHFIEPSLDPMPKRVVFALDVSGSMFGHKLKQLRLAMSNILNQFRPDDQFSIIVFNSSVTRWEPEGLSTTLAPATPTYVSQAKSFLDEVMARGGTDILQAAQAAINMLSVAVEESSADSALGGLEASNPAADYVILLTDGRSNEGVSEAKDIQAGIVEDNQGRFGIHTVGFGTLVDAKMLRKIAAQNKGTSAQIFVDIDTHTQMVDFFSAISRPVLTNVTVQYPVDTVRKSSETFFDATFTDSEIIIAGRFGAEFVIENTRPRRRRDLSFESLAFTFSGRDRKDRRSIPETSVPRNLADLCTAAEFQILNFAQRLNTFLELKNLLRRIDATTNSTEEEILRNETLQLSLTNKFVTPGITALIVLKPDDLKEVEDTIEATSTVAPTTTVPTTARASSGGSSGGRVRPTQPPRRFHVFGDPHVIVDLDDELTICFNWHGGNNQYYNLLYDNGTGITVNAKLAKVPPSVSLKHNTYVEHLGLVFRKQNVTVDIDVKGIKITAGRNKPRRLPMNKKRSISVRGIRFDIAPLSDNMGSVEITVNPKIQFKILARINSANNDITNHLDFSITRMEGLSRHISGLLGQLPLDEKKNKKRFKMSFMDTSKGLLTFKHNVVKVKNKNMYDSYVQSHVQCWYLDHPSDLTGHTENEYLVAKLFDQPVSKSS